MFHGLGVQGGRLWGAALCGRPGRQACPADQSCAAWVWPSSPRHIFQAILVEPLVGASLLSEAKSRRVCMFCRPPDTGGHSGCSGRAVCSGLGGLCFRLSGAGSRAGGLPALVSCPSSRLRCCRGAVLLQLLPAAGGLSPSARPQGSAQTGGQGLSGGANALPASQPFPATPAACSCPPSLPGQYLVLHLLSLRRHPVCSLPACVRVSHQLAAGFPSVDEHQPRRGGVNGVIRAAGSAGPRPPSPKLLVFPSASRFSLLSKCESVSVGSRVTVLSPDFPRAIWKGSPGRDSQAGGGRSVCPHPPAAHCCLGDLRSQRCTPRPPPAGPRARPPLRSVPSILSRGSRFSTSRALCASPGSFSQTAFHLQSQAV